MAESPSDFMAGFSARLMALARAHDLLTRREWQGVSLDELVRRTIAPYGAQLGSSRIDMKGEHIELPPNTAVVLNMVLHELATNAAKYGALSKPEGVVSVHWTIDRQPGMEPHLSLEWTERGGPPVNPSPQRRGFGMRLIERSLASEMGGASKLEFAPTGLRCTMRLYIRQGRRSLEPPRPSEQKT
jgi:two-component sensor histidine kinase